MGLLIYPLIQGREAGWPAWTYLMVIASAVSFGLLVLNSRRLRRAGRDPLVDATIFSHRAYTAGLASIVVFFAGMIGTLLVLTLYLQFGEHFSPIHAGLTLAPFAAGSAAGAALAATVLVPRLGRTVLQLASVIIAIGTLLLRHVIAAHGLATTATALIFPQLVVGLGIGMLISPLFDFILASVTATEIGSASGVLNAVQQLAGAIGVAGIGTIFFTVLQHSGFVAAITESLYVELGITPLLLLLTGMLPAHARNPELATGPDQTDVEPRDSVSVVAEGIAAR
jgi:predicted MFS family arabinose efflux permease